jgi:hypothetical protein
MPGMGGGPLQHMEYQEHGRNWRGRVRPRRRGYAGAREAGDQWSLSRRLPPFLFRHSRVGRELPRSHPLRVFQGGSLHGPPSAPRPPPKQSGGRRAPQMAVSSSRRTTSRMQSGFPLWMTRQLWAANRFRTTAGSAASGHGPASWIRTPPGSRPHFVRTQHAWYSTDVLLSHTAMSTNHTRRSRSFWQRRPGQLARIPRHAPEPAAVGIPHRLATSASLSTGVGPRAARFKAYPVPMVRPLSHARM